MAVGATSAWWVVAWAGPLALITALTVAFAFWKEPRIRRRIEERDRTGIDERATMMTLTLSVPLEVAIDIASDLLSRQHLQYGTSVTRGESGNEVRCRLGPNWQTWGQTLSVEAVAADGRTDLTIRSWPTWDRAVTDWGRGRRVVAQVVQELRAESERLSAPT